MAATVEIRSYHGATPDAGTDVAGGSMRFKLADNDTADANNPVVIPAAGTNYSWIKQLKFYAATTPDNVINNLRFYTDGAIGYGTGIGLDVGSGSAYIDPTSFQDSGLVDWSGQDAEGFTSGAPYTITGSLSNPSTGAFGDYIRLQVNVDDTASQGTSSSETIYFSYDES